MIDEIYRVLSPGSRYVTFSLHTIEEVEGHYRKDRYNWHVSTYRVKSSRWNEQEHLRRAVAHTMIVCDKPNEEGRFSQPFPHTKTMENILTEEEYLEMKGRADQVNALFALCMLLLILS
jgi:hypothetical protein